MRVGIIGYGLAGSVFHGPLVASTPGAVVAAVVTSDADRAARARREHPDAVVVASVDDLWAMRESLDLVVIAAANRAHAALATAAIDHGLAVVVDKPLAATAAEARALVEHARSRGVLLTVFFNRRWDGDFLTVRSLVEAGALGDIARLESRFERWRPVPKVGWRESGSPADAGGTLMDLGSHLVDQALQLLGPVTHVYAEVERRRPDVLVDDDAFVSLLHASGARSHLWTSAVAGHLGPRFRVLGSGGAYVIEGLDEQEASLASGLRPGDSAWAAASSGRGGRRAGDDEVVVPTLPGQWDRYYAAVAASLRGEAAVPVDPADAVVGLEILEAARLSASRRTVVELEP